MTLEEFIHYPPGKLFIRCNTFEEMYECITKLIDADGVFLSEEDREMDWTYSVISRHKSEVERFNKKGYREYVFIDSDHTINAYEKDGFYLNGFNDSEAILFSEIGSDVLDDSFYDDNSLFEFMDSVV